MGESVKPIKDTMRSIMLLMLKVFRTQILKRIDNVENDDLYKGIEISFIPMEQIVVALNDDNPDNKEQVKDIMLAWINGPVSDLLEEIFSDLVSKSKNEHVKALFTEILGLGVSTLKIYTDDDNKNNEQLDKLFDAFLESAEAKELVVKHILHPLLSKVIKDDNIVSSIVEVIEKALEGIKTK